MKVIVKDDYQFLSGWVRYNMVWRTKYTGIRNRTLQSVVVFSKEPFSSKVLKEMASEQGYDLDSLFTEFDRYKEDLDKMNQFSAIFNKWNEKNIEEINSDNKCNVRYTATLDPNYKPLETPYMTIQVYQVHVLIEFNFKAAQFPIYSLGRKKESYPFNLISGGKTEEMYEEEEAIEKINARIENDITDCDTEEKYYALGFKLVDIQTEQFKKMGII